MIGNVLRLLIYITILVTFINFITIGTAFNRIEALKDKIKELENE